MTEAEARAVLLVRAFEAAPAAAWSAADAEWATAEARRAEGERVPFERFVARRAQFALARLVQRDPKIAATLAALAPRAWVGGALALAAFVLGIASDVVGAGNRINLLAPPLFAVLAWNLAVYVLLLLRAAGPLRRFLLRAVPRLHAGASTALKRFVGDWIVASGGLRTARLSALLHAAAAAFVVGALLSLYLRGIAYEYRAGWESTFLQADNVENLLAVVLGPAAYLSGIALPDADELLRLRFSSGVTTQQNAAPWIHLWAITLGLAVVVPRTLLATLAGWRALAMARNFALALDGDDFARLRRIFSGEAVAALVLPYSYRLADSAGAALKHTLERVAGPNVALTIAPPLPQGAEDEVHNWLGRPAALVVALFPLTATPERETHGAFVEALAARRAAPRLLVLVDESDFRRRFTGAEGARRLGERRDAWTRMLAATHAEVMFADLDAGT